MKKSFCVLWYLLIFLIPLVIDRITKIGALLFFLHRYRINRFLSFECIFNRGISWGIFHSCKTIPFMATNFMIALIILSLSVYTYVRWKQNYYIVGELLVLSGALSNMIDRIVYHKVIDFIVLSIGRWSWPVFNIADTYIVIGIGIMLIENYKHYKQY